MTRMERDWLWPSADVDCAAVTFGQVADADKALAHVKNFGSCVQAGGNTGVWAEYLSRRFGAVYSFEPDAENFRCLVHNTPDNVFRFQSCLGREIGFVNLHRELRNCGAYYVEGKGKIPTLRIDDLGLEDCGLIVLDVEGYEPLAFQGALTTIRRCKPVLMYEDKSLSEKYGYKKGIVEEAMEEEGYRVAARIHRDVILVC